MNMSDKELDRVVQNETEWRKMIWKELSETRQELHNFKLEMTSVTTTLKIKIGTFGTIFGFIGGTIVSAILALIKT